MTTTEIRPGGLAHTRRALNAVTERLIRLSVALDDAEDGGATVMRIDEVRAIVGPTAAQIAERGA